MITQPFVIFGTVVSKKKYIYLLKTLLCGTKRYTSCYLSSYINTFSYTYVTVRKINIFYFDILAIQSTCSLNKHDFWARLSFTPLQTKVPYYYGHHCPMTKYLCVSFQTRTSPSRASCPPSRPPGSSPSLLRRGSRDISNKWAYLYK